VESSAFPQKFMGGILATIMNTDILSLYTNWLNNIASRNSHLDIFKEFVAGINVIENDWEQVENHGVYQFQYILIREYNSKRKTENEIDTRQLSYVDFFQNAEE
jgi:hypothetical protein